MTITTYDYVDNTFLSKDVLASGENLKVLQGWEFEKEFLAIEAAVNSKLDADAGQATGTMTAVSITTSGTLTAPTTVIASTLTVTGATVVGLTGGTF